MKWLIDDSIKSRSNRQAIQSHNYTHIGIATSRHAQNGQLTVVVMVQYIDDTSIVKQNNSILGLLPDSLIIDNAHGIYSQRSVTSVGNTVKNKYDVDYKLPDGRVDKKSAVNIKKKPEQGGKNDALSLDADQKNHENKDQKPKADQRLDDEF